MRLWLWLFLPTCTHLQHAKHVLFACLCTGYGGRFCIGLHHLGLMHHVTRAGAPSCTRVMMTLGCGCCGIACCCKNAGAAARMLVLLHKNAWCVRPCWLLVHFVVCCFKHHLFCQLCVSCMWNVALVVNSCWSTHAGQHMLVNACWSTHAGSHTHAHHSYQTPL